MKKVILILIISLGCLILFACSSDAADAPNADAPSAEASATPQPAAIDDTDTTESQHNAEADIAQDAAGTEHQSDNSPTPEPEPAPATPATGELTISFDYTRQSGSASNQHAVWIEDMDGRLIKTLFASRWTARGGYRTRPDSIALWTEIADPANMETADIDAIAGVTPRAGLQSYTWDLTDLNGETVLKGDYRFFVEGTLRWKNFVLISGVIRIGDEPETVQGDAVFHYEGTDRYPELTDDSTENNMIGAVTAVFIP